MNLVSAKTLARNRPRRREAAEPKKARRGGLGALRSSLKAKMAANAAPVNNAMKMLTEMTESLVRSKLIIRAFRENPNLSPLSDAQLAMLAYAGTPQRFTSHSPKTHYVK